MLLWLTPRHTLRVATQALDGAQARCAVGAVERAHFAVFTAVECEQVMPDAQCVPADMDDVNWHGASWGRNERASGASDSRGLRRHGGYCGSHQQVAA